MVGLVVTTGQHGDVECLWLRRSDHGNALDPDTVSRLHDELSTAESKSDCLAVVIRAEGSVFCAGADVRASAELMRTPELLLSFFDSGRRLMERLVTSRLATIAVVQGLAAAGGLELASAADLVIATDSAVFADRHATFGFLPAFGATTLLPMRVGGSVATSMLLGKRELDASTALAAGLAHRVCSADELDGVIDDEIIRLRQVGVEAISAIKRLINEMQPVNFAPEGTAVRKFEEEGGYDPSRFIARVERGRDSGR